MQTMPDISARSMRKDSNYGNDLSYLIRQQETLSDREKDLSLYRSGSAPPTVEGSLSSFGGLWGGSGPTGLETIDNKRFVTEGEVRADPAYVDYYYFNANLNPRLPPPLISKEDWRSKLRFQGSGLGEVGDRRRDSRERGDSEAENWNLFSFRQGENGNEDSDAGLREVADEWGGNGINGLPGLSFGSRKKSFAEIIQDDSSKEMAISRRPSRAASRNTFDTNLEVNDQQGAYLHQDIPSINGLHTYAAALGASKSRSSTPDPRLGTIAPSPCFTPGGVERVNFDDKGGVYNLNSSNGVSPSFCDSSDLTSAFSHMNLLKNGVQKTSVANKGDFEKFHVTSAHQLAKGSGQSNALLMSDEQAISSAKSYINEFSTLVPIDRLSSLPHPQNVDRMNSFADYGLSGYAVKPSSPSMMENCSFPASFENSTSGSAMRVGGINSRALEGGLSRSHLLEATAELQNIGRFRDHNSPIALHSTLMVPSYIQNLKSNEYNAAQVAVLSDHTLDMDWMGNNSHMDLLGIQNGYLGNSFSPSESQFSLPGYYDSSSFGRMFYPERTISGHLLPNSSVGLGHPITYSEYGLQFPSGMSNSPASIRGNLDETFVSSFLDEFKNNKTKCFELSEIAGHVVDFSTDQYGSRFIQQKLETASTEDKTMVFQEILPHALSLMTDVFGNYVIQKFFELGSAPQIKELADQLTGHVLALTLQMYGCRVIQKAIEVVDLDQQIKMVSELDGQIMRCVRDQNGNHVIQKCIECVPENIIHFIVSTFYDQIVTLSTHPYGCRVIQRVLEHCRNAKTQQIMMDEILQSVCLLAQDQYGNYVVQHVLEHGKEQERSAIIKKLTGQIVQMSRQKFASNVIEKCLTFGTSTERQSLVNEMLGCTDENEPLQAMMKDQFGNYVVQKVLETCDDNQLELILSRIKVHLTALKKYTYGKHIVARVEKLVAAGERRISILTLQPAVMSQERISTAD